MREFASEGHGHVTPRADGVKARCGGPGLCKQCSVETARKHVGCNVTTCPDVHCAESGQCKDAA